MNGVRRLPLVKVIWGTFAFPWMFREAWFRAVRFPLWALIAVTLLWYTIDSQANYFEIALWYTAYLATTSWLAVRTHRLVLMDSAAPVVFAPANEPRTVGIYLATAALLWVIFLVVWVLIASIVVSGWIMLKTGGAVASPSSPPAFDPEIQAGIMPLTMLSAVPSAYLLARLSPLLPAVALDRPWSPRAAWEFSTGNGWRLAIVVVALPVAFAKTVELLSRDGASSLEYGALAVALAVLTSLEIIALSLSYRELERIEPPPTDPPA